MALPLALPVAVFLSLAASAQTGPQSPQEFKAAVIKAFSERTPVKDITPAGQDKKLVSLYQQVLAVQSGQDDSKDKYEKMIRSVARSLEIKEPAKVDAIVKRYLEKPPVRVVAATADELAGREAIVQELAQRNAARLATTRQRTTATMKTIQNFRNATDNLADGNAANGGFVFGGGRTGIATVVAYRPETADATALPRAQQLVGFRQYSPAPVSPATTTPPPAVSSPFSLSSLLPFIDWDKGMRVASEAVGGVVDSVKKASHRCYNFVKQALIDAGIIDAPNPQSTAVVGLRPGLARMFNEDVARNPKILDRLGYRRADMGSLGQDPSQIPPGTIFIYGAHCAFAQYKDAGHAELAVTREDYEQARREKPRFGIRPLESDQVPACHYTCAGRSMNYLRTYGKGANACLRMYVPVVKSS